MTEESDSEQGEKIVTHQLLWRSECEPVYNYYVSFGFNNMVDLSPKPIRDIYMYCMYAPYDDIYMYNYVTTIILVCGIHTIFTLN